MKLKKMVKALREIGKYCAERECSGCIFDKDDCNCIIQYLPCEYEDYGLDAIIKKVEGRDDESCN